MADEPEQTGGGWEPCTVAPRRYLSRERESVTHGFAREQRWEYGKSPMSSLLLGHYSYRRRPYFEMRTRALRLFSPPMFLC